MRRALLLLALAACVPKGQHEITSVQLSATRTALSAQVQQCAADQQAAEARVAELEAEIALRQAQLDEIVARHALDEEAFARHAADLVAVLAEVEALKAERDHLLSLVPKRARPETPAGAPAAAAVEAAVAAALRDSHAHDVDEARTAAAHEAVVGAFAALVAEGKAEVEPRGSGTVVRFPTSLLFQEGFTTLSPRGAVVVSAAAEALAGLPGRRVVVEGHTDDAPIHSAAWPSNWERGFSRAVAVLRALEAAGVPALSVASYADTRPLVPHDREGAAARNDRVELLVEVDPGLLEAFPTSAPEEEEEEEEEEAAPAP